MKKLILALCAGFIVMITRCTCSPVQSFHPNVLEGGRAISIAVNPSDSQIMFVVSETGGLFKTTDGGNTWKHVDKLPSYVIRDIAFAPSDPNILIAAALYDFKIDNGPIWRSADGGDTWSMPAGSKPLASNRCGDKVSAYSISFEPGSNNVYVGTDCGLAVSTDLGVSWKHTVADTTVVVNNERTQNRVWSVLAQRGAEINLAASDGLWYSSGGTIWNKASTDPTGGQDWITHAFAPSPFDPSTIFLAGHWNNLWKTTNGGATWNQIPSPSTWNREAFVRAAENLSAGANKFDVFFGDGTNISSQTFEQTPGGPTGTGTWKTIVTAHADPADIAFNPTNKNPILLVTDGGIHKKSNTISLKAHNNQYVAAEGGGGGDLNANRNQIGLWESYILIDLNGGSLMHDDDVQIKTCNNHFIKAEGGGGAVVNSSSTEAHEQETFKIVRISGAGQIVHGNSIALKTQNGKFISAVNGGGSGVNAIPSSVANNETFTIEFGETWFMAGGGANGYNALQITEVTGEQINGTNSHQDYYYGTQDNDIVASSDGGTTWPHRVCCEGFFLRVVPIEADHSSTKVTFVACGACGNFITDEHLTNFNYWSNPTDGDAINDDVDGNPFLVKKDYYVQNTINNDITPRVNNFKLTTNTGSSWNNSYTITQELRGVPVIAGPPDNPTIYQAIRRPGATLEGFQKIGLVKITNIYGPGAAVITDADVNGFGSIGLFPTMFAWYTVFGVNPDNPNHLILPDVETDQMKVSYDGGVNWNVDTLLTKLVTANSSFYFRDREFPIVHTVSWDPYNNCHILVGTAQNGIIHSVDGGITWSKIDDSNNITNLSSFYFPPEGKIVASTYGRGLWKINMNRTTEPCIPQTITPPRIPKQFIIDMLGIRKPFKWDPETCPKCNYLFVKNGRITDINLDGLTLTKISISGGSIYQFDQKKKEVSLEIPNDYKIRYGKFSRNERLLSIVKEGIPIRGLVFEQSTLKAVIVSETELPVKPERTPYIKVITNNMMGGVAKVSPGGTVKVYGEGFSGSTGNSIILMIDNKPIIEKIRANEKGIFEAEFKVNRLAGDYEITVIQKDGKRMIMEKTNFKVMLDDSFREPIKKYNK